MCAPLEAVSDPRMPASMTSLVESVFYLLFAFKQAFHDRCAPRYLGSLVREILRKSEMVLLHDVEYRFFREIAVVSGKEAVHVSDLFIGHGRAPTLSRLHSTAARGQKHTAPIACGLKSANKLTRTKHEQSSCELADAHTEANGKDGQPG
jgi:hypothetical protein